MYSAVMNALALDPIEDLFDQATRMCGSGKQLILLAAMDSCVLIKGMYHITMSIDYQHVDLANNHINDAELQLSFLMGRVVKLSIWTR